MVLREEASSRFLWRWQQRLMVQTGATQRQQRGLHAQRQFGGGRRRAPFHQRQALPATVTRRPPQILVEHVYADGKHPGRENQDNPEAEIDHEYQHEGVKKAPENTPVM